MQKVEIILSDEDKRRKDLFNSRPPLDEILNLHDFEVRIDYFYIWIAFPDHLVVDVIFTVATGHREASHAGEGLGILLLCRGRRDHEQGEPRRLPQVCIPVDLGRFSSNNSSLFV